MISTLLSSYGISILNEGYQIGLDWLGHFARIIIEGVGIIGAGIIVFTLVLKAITLPFDIYQRIKMRKQTLLMRKMQPELEKLQEQYANDKNMYNQKMMELYKKNGYGMLGACLPMLISLVILIVAFQGFRTYSQYANLEMYVKMSAAYNSAVLEHCVDGKDFKLPVEGQEDDEFTIRWTESPTVTEEGNVKTSDIVHTEEGIEYTYRTVETTTDGNTETRKFLYVRSLDDTKYIYYLYSLDAGEVSRSYYVNADLLKNAEGENFNAFLTEGVSEELACKNFVNKIGAVAAAEWYHDNDASFLWVKNVWYPDVSYQHPIQDYTGFSSNFKNVKVTDAEGTEKDLLNVLDESSYNNLVSELKEETTAPNGYFIMIILSIGLMVLSQFISMRSNKETNQYQTVDGSGAKTQKMMLIIMPLMYAIFAFMYSAAFSIYMIMSSVVAILITLFSNLFIGLAFRKKEEKEAAQQNVRLLPWMKDANGKQDKDKKNKNNDRKNNGKRG